jgi:hypothetical protein
MMVLNNKCKECNDICYTNHFQLNFLNWTSGNNDIDKFIQNTQLSSHGSVKNVLEWIPNNRFCNIKHITQTRYSASWVDGNITYWDNKTQNWKRNNQNMIVELEVLNNPKNITLEFMDKVRKIYHYYKFWNL